MRVGPLLTSANPMNFGDWASAIQNIVQVAAIVIGALWAYYKFFRGRVFHRRAEVGVDASLLATGSSHAILAKATLQNTGGADIPLRLKVVRVLSFRHGDLDEKGRPAWRNIALVPLFGDHDWIESQETIADDVLVSLRPEDADDHVLAFRVSCLVYEHRRKKVWEKLLFFRADPGGGICWTTNTIVPAGLAPVKGGASKKDRKESS